MTKLLERAFAEASKLPDADQDAIASRMLEGLESDQRWDELFGKSQDLLDRLASETLAEDDAGLTEPLDPDDL
jgi:hypothetical protein